MRSPVLLIVASFAVACGSSTLDIDEEGAYVDHDPGVIMSGLTAGEAGGCSTAIVGGLDNQLIEELNCISPNLMTSFAGPHTRYGATVVPFLHPSAAAALKRATTAANDFMTINSAYRTVAQQFVLYRWWQQGRCSIQVAAAPGASNHQSGRALDVQSYTFWRPYLQNQGWTWLGASDVVHYDYLSAPALGGRSVLAFQKLWNKNHSSGKLAEDGVWGPASNAAMAASPVTGFANHGCAAPPAPTTGTLKGTVYAGSVTTAVIAGATVVAGGKTVTTDAAGAFSVVLPVGMQSIKVTATGYEDAVLTRQVAGGQTVTANIGLNPKGMPDTVPPDLSIAMPAADMASSDVALISVSGTASDMGGGVTLALSQNGAAKVPVVLMGTMFEHQVTLTPGMNTLELTATDSSGNVATKRVYAQFRAGLEGEVTTPDLRADGIEGVAITLTDTATGAVLMSTQSGTDGTYAFEVDTVPLNVKLTAEAKGYTTFTQELEIGADARKVFSFALSRGEGVTMEQKPEPNGEDMKIGGGCSATAGLPLGLLALALLRRRRLDGQRVSR